MSGRPAARRRLTALVGILLFVMVAPWLAPRSPELQEDPAGARYLPPLTRAHALRIDAFHLRIVTHLRETSDGWEFERAGRTGSLPAAALLGTPETRFYLLGTDGLGRDLLSRVLTGARHSLGIAALSVILAILLGAGAGSAAGLLGGVWDTLIMRGVDVVMSIPRLLVYLVCAALFPPSSLLLVLVLGATTWTGLARIVRAEMMSIRGSDLALGARAVGSRPLRVVLLHLLPQMGPVLATTASLRFADTLLLESALSLLGLGPPAVSLGAIMGSGRDVLADAWWVVVWPGVVISATVGTLRATAAGLFRLADPPSLS
ncbi:MAG: peptide ABC transporter permease [Acidobacteria bacterium]|nr:MAG: peptide ABC transporter permease [Acidobacteriota bacterium]